MPDVLIESPWLMLTALPLLGVAVWVLVRTGSPLSRSRRLFGGIALALAVIALVAAAAEVAWQQAGSGRTIWVLVDRSLSAGDNAERRLQGVLEELAHSIPEGDYVGVIGYGGRAELTLSPTPAAQLDPSLKLPPSMPSDETLLGAALELAVRSTVPGTAPVALTIGDGYDSADRYGGDVVMDARTRATPVFAIPVDSAPLPEVALADLRARLMGNEKQVIALELVIHSSVPQYVIPEIRLDGQSAAGLIQGERLNADGGFQVGSGRTPLLLTLEPEQQRAVHTIEVALAADNDTHPGNNTGHATVQGGGDSHVLLIYGSDGPELALTRALRRAGMRVTSGDPTLLPSRSEELQRFQAVLLCSVAASDISVGQQSMIESFVRGGGGLAMIGGPDAYAPGGWYETAVERVLPVTSDVTEKGRKQTPAMVIAVDRSGSMSGQVGTSTKMDLANEGAVRAAKLLPPASLFGLVSVNTQASWIVPFTELEDRRLTESLLRSNSWGGAGIFVDVAMRAALPTLQNATATSRHLVLFSDGSDTEFSRNGSPQSVVEEVAQANEKHDVTLSVICLGDGKDRPFLEQLAAAGKGRFFLVTDATALPAVFSREAAQTAGAFLREEPFRPWPGLQGRMVEGVDFRSEQSPPLLGYVATTARPEASVWLWADEDRERPLLATWHVGVGKALAFTSDARDRWAEQWLGWSAYDEMWQRWIEWLLPQPENTAGLESEWTMTAGGPELLLWFFDPDGNPRDLRSPDAEIILPDGTTRSTRVLPAAPGSYRVQFPAGGPGAYSAIVSETADSGERRSAARLRRMLVPVQELISRPADTATLRAIGDATGGKVVATAREVAEARVAGGLETVRPNQLPIWLGLAGLLLGLGARRLPSVWRRRDGKQVTAEDSEQLTNVAFDRVRKRMEQARKPRRNIPPPGVVPPVAHTRNAPAASSAESALSAMRKVRNELKEKDSS